MQPYATRMKAYKISFAKHILNEFLIVNLKALNRYEVINYKILCRINTAIVLHKEMKKYLVILTILCKNAEKNKDTLENIA